MKGKIHELRIGIIQKRLMPLFMSIIFISYTLCGCAGTTKQIVRTGTGEKDRFVHVIINDQAVKSEKYGPKLVSNIEDVFRESFENVSVKTGYDNPERGELLITPRSLRSSLEEPKGPAVYLVKAESTITLSYDGNHESYTVDGRGNYEPSGGERWAGLFGIAVTLAVSGVVQRALWKSTAVNRAMESIAIDLHNKAISSSQFMIYAETQKMLKTATASLIAEIQFCDKSSLLPNNSIDAGEQSAITATISNNGKGTAFDVNLSAESKYRNIDFPKTISVGDIQPGESKDLTIPIKADLSLKTGTAKFCVKANEKRGYDARPVELQIPTAELRSPKLLFASCNFNDSSGLASGDGDGIAENNETIELNPYVKNDGVGDALKVSVKLIDVTQGIELTKGNDQLATIGPGTIGKATLAFKIPRTFSQPEIKYIIAAKDVRGMQTE